MKFSPRCNNKNRTISWRRKYGVKTFVMLHRCEGYLGFPLDDFHPFIVFASKSNDADWCSKMLFEYRLRGWDGEYDMRTFGTWDISSENMFGLGKFHANYDDIKSQVKNRKDVFYAYIDEDHRLCVMDFERKKKYSIPFDNYFVLHKEVTTTDLDDEN